MFFKQLCELNIIKKDGFEITSNGNSQAHIE